MGLRIEEIEGAGGLWALRPAWEALWRRASDATPFSSPAWLLPWCDHLADVAPFAIAVWRGTSLAALAPTFVYADGRRRTLGLLGGGVSDYQDVLAADDVAVEALLGHLLRRGDRFELADLRSVPARSRLRLAADRCGARVRVGPEAASAVVPLTSPRTPLALPPPARASAREAQPPPAELEEIVPRASPRLLHDVQYQRRRLVREGGLEVARVTAPSQLAAALDDLFRLHGARWTSRGEPGVLADDRVRRFHRAVASELLTLGALRLFTLRTGGQAVAASYGMTAHGRSYLYLFGTDPTHSRRSPGSLVVAQAIEDAYADGCRLLDLLRGEEPYKARWGAMRAASVRLRFRPALARRQVAERPRSCARDVGTRAWPPGSS